MDAPLSTSLARVRRLGQRVRRLGQRVPRWLRITLYVVVGSYLFYLLAANVILRTHLLRGWVNKDENKLRLEYGSAWSTYPGHVVVRDISLRYQDSNIQMLIQVDRASLQFDPAGIANHTIRISKLEAEGTTFKLRAKLETLEGSEGRVSAFPPIEGFSDPPIEKKVPKPPIPDDQYELWTIEMTDVSASLREVWTMEYRFRGEGSVKGGFHLRPKRELWVYPSVMVTSGGLLSLGDRDLIRGGEARLEVHVDPFDTREFPGVDVTRNMSARVHQSGELVLPSIAETYLPKSMPLTFENGVGPVAIDVAIEHGVVQPETRLTFHSAETITKVSPVTVRSDLDVVGRVEITGETPAIVLDTTIARATVTPALDVRGVRTMIDLGTADVTVPFEVARLSAAVTSARAGDLRAWQPVAPENTTFDGGAATLAARADYHGGALEGRFDVALADTRMTIGTTGFACTGKVSSNVASEAADKAVAFTGATAALHDVALRMQSGHAEGITTRARFERTILTTSGAVGFDTDIGVEAGPGDRMLKLFTRMASLPDVAADAASGSEATAVLRLRVRPGDISLVVAKAKDGALEGRGRLRKRTSTPLTGAFLLSAGPFHTGLDLHDDKVTVVPLAGGSWLDEKLQKR